MAMAYTTSNKGVSVALKALTCSLLLLALLVSPLAALFIANEGDVTLAAVQLPISPNSYLEVIPPGNVGGCDWTVCGQYSVSPGRCDPAYICLYEDYVGVDWSTAIKSDPNLIAIVNNATQYLGFRITPGSYGGYETDVAYTGIPAFNTILNVMQCFGLIVTYNDGLIYMGKILDTDVFDSTFGTWTIDHLIPPPGTPNCTFNYSALPP